METGSHLSHMVKCPKNKRHKGVELKEKKVTLKVAKRKGGRRYFTSSIPGDGYPHILSCAVCGIGLKETGKKENPSKEVKTNFFKGGRRKKKEGK